jgi:hypothetical protein
MGMCNCSQCNNTDHLNVFGSSPTSHANEVFVEASKGSVNDRLHAVATELHKYGAPPHLVQEIISVTNRVDEIATDLAQLKSDCIRRPVEYTQATVSRILEEIE